MKTVTIVWYSKGYLSTGEKGRQEGRNYTHARIVDTSPVDPLLTLAVTGWSSFDDKLPVSLSPILSSTKPSSS
jgi:hypothetical protein